MVLDQLESGVPAKCGTVGQQRVWTQKEDRSLVTSSVKIDEGRKKVSLTKPTFDRVNIPVSLSGGGWKNLSPRIRSWPGKAFSGTSFPALHLASFTGQETSLKPPTPLSTMFTCHTHAPTCISPDQGQMEVQRQIQKKLGGRGMP